jgi:MFS family permease
MFFTSNYFYAYQGSIVAHMFSPRTRALSSFLSNFGAVIGAIIIGVVLDRSPGSRRTRSIIGWCFTVFFMCLVWGAGIGWQSKFSRSDPEGSRYKTMDWVVKDSRGPLVLMFAYYMVDSFYQGLAYYTMSTITNDPFRLARMAGYYKGVQSAGAAISFGMDAVKTKYMTEVIVSFVIMMVSLPLCLLVLWHTTDSNYEAENTLHVENLDEDQLHHVALPEGHHAHHDEKVDEVHNEVKELKSAA